MSYNREGPVPAVKMNVGGISTGKVFAKTIADPTRALRYKPSILLELWVSQLPGTAKLFKQRTDLQKVI